MISRLENYFNQPYPFNSDPKNYIKVVLVFTAFVGLFLLFFQPFGINNLPGNQPIWASLGFAGVTFVSLLFFMALTQLFPNYFQEDNWTLGKEIVFSLINFLAVGHGNYLFIRYAWVKEYDLLDYTSMILGTFAVGFFPYLFMLLTQHMRTLSRNVNQAQEISQAISSSKDSPLHDSTVKFEGENESDELSLSLDKLLYVQASGNYIEVVYNEGNHINKSILRSSLSSAENLLDSFQNIYRCHRTYLVNLERVVEVEGNSQGYRLKLDRDVDSVPVARTKNSEFRSIMNELRVA